MALIASHGFALLDLFAFWTRVLKSLVFCTVELKWWQSLTSTDVVWRAGRRCIWRRGRQCTSMVTSAVCPEDAVMMTVTRLSSGPSCSRKKDEGRLTTFGTSNGPNAGGGEWTSLPSVAGGPPSCRGSLCYVWTERVLGSGQLVRSVTGHRDSFGRNIFYCATVEGTKICLSYNHVVQFSNIFFYFFLLSFLFLFSFSFFLFFSWPFFSRLFRGLITGPGLNRIFGVRGRNSAFDFARDTFAWFSLSANPRERPGFPHCSAHLQWSLQPTSQHGRNCTVRPSVQSGTGPQRCTRLQHLFSSCVYEWNTQLGWKKRKKKREREKEKAVDSLNF